MKSIWGIHYPMTPIRKILSQADFTIILLMGLSAGLGAGLFAGALSSDTFDQGTALALLLAYAVVIFAIFSLVLCVLASRRTAKLSRLRDEGTLPAAATQSDADVIRLANLGLREEAALVYQEIHGGQLDAARFVVGLDKLRTIMLCIIFFLIFIVTTLHMSSKGNQLDLTLNTGLFAAVVLSNFVIFSARAKRLRENREKLASGILPTPDSACLFRKSCTNGGKDIPTTK
jgi:preprotein translocase subunit SecG